MTADLFDEIDLAPEISKYCSVAPTRAYCASRRCLAFGK